MLRIVFGEKVASVRAEAGVLRVGVACPVVSGSPEQDYAFGAGAAGAHGEWTTMTLADGMLLAASAPVEADSVESVTRRLYDALFVATRGLHLVRIWHFVPGILDRPDGRDETYRRFCLARAESFDAAFASDAEARMPAASATGTDGDRLVIVAVASAARPEHFENPRQTPAYRYPKDYGPRPPSFARATRARLGGGDWVFVSGTAAVSGSDSMFAGDMAAQTRLMRENLDMMSRLATRGERTGDDISRVYLKHGCAAPAGLREPLVVVSDVCRDELLIEAETTVRLRN